MKLNTHGFHTRHLVGSNTARVFIVHFSGTYCTVQWHLLYTSVTLTVQWHLLYSSVAFTVQFSGTYCTLQWHLQFSGTYCTVQWHLLYTSVAFTVHFSDTYCTVQCHLLYGSVVLTVHFSGTYCAVQCHLLYSSVAHTQASLITNNNCIVSEALIKTRSGGTWYHVIWKIGPTDVSTEYPASIFKVIEAGEENVSLPSITQLSPQLLMYNLNIFVILHTLSLRGKSPLIFPHT